MTALAIALNGVRLTFRSREGLFWIFIGPLIMATFFGIVFKPQPPAPITIDIVNLDATDSVMSSIADSLQKDGVVVARAASVGSTRPTLVMRGSSMILKS